MMKAEQTLTKTGMKHTICGRYRSPGRGRLFRLPFCSGFTDPLSGLASGRVLLKNLVFIFTILLHFNYGRADNSLLLLPPGNTNGQILTHQFETRLGITLSVHQNNERLLSLNRPAGIKINNTVGGIQAHHFANFSSNQIVGIPVILPKFHLGFANITNSLLSENKTTCEENFYTTENESLNFQFVAEICDNGIDDDGDGLIDHADPDCPGVTKQLYLSDPSQALDRVHPGLVSPVDNTTASTSPLVVGTGAAGAFGTPVDISNQLGDNSITPDVAVYESGGTETVHMVFNSKKSGASKRNIYYSGKTGAGAWTAPVLISSDAFNNDAQSYPSVAVDANNKVHVVYAHKNGATDSKINIYYVTNASGSWSAPVRISSNSFGEDAFTPDIALDASGKAYVAYTHRNGSTDSKINIYYVTNAGGSWSAPVRISSNSFGNDALQNPAIAVDASNKAHVAFSHRNGSTDSKINIYYVTNASGSWSSPARISNDSFNQDARSNPSIAIDGNGKPHVVYGHKNGSTDSKVNIYYVNKTGASWSSPVNVSGDINGQDSFNPDLAMSATGTIRVAFSNISTNVFYTENSGSGGSWIAPVDINPATPTKSTDGDNPAVAVSSSLVHVVYQDKHVTLSGDIDVWHISAPVSPVATTMTFTQAPSMCSPLTIKAGQPITITTYVSIISGTMPASPAISAVLKYGSTNIITLNNPTYNSGTGILTWTGTLGSAVTVPAGQAVALQLTTAQTGVSFRIDYDSQTKPSKIDLPVSTYIDITSFAMYDAPYPGGSIISNASAGSTVYLRAAVTDPFGSSDITGLNISITPPGSSVAATSVATAGCTRTYEYPWVVPAGGGTYNMLATAREGYENTVTDVFPLTISFCSPVIGDPVFTAGASSNRCQGAGTATYSATSTNSTGLSYSLDAASLAAGNTINASTGAVTFVAGWTGTSTVQVTANGCGGPKFTIHTVTTGAIPSANAGPDLSICAGSSTTLNASASGGNSPYTFDWSNGLGSGASKTVSPASTTTYTVTVTSATGCTSTDQVVITVNPAPVANAGANQTICYGGSATLTATASGGASPYVFNWSNGLGTGASKTVSPASTTTYTVTVTGANSCTSTSQVTVNVNPQLTASAGSNVTICTGTGTTLNATATGGTSPYTFNWSNGLGSGASKAVSPLITTTYTVTTTDAAGCTATSQVTVNVSALFPIADAGPQQNICGGANTTITATATGGVTPYTFMWDNGLGAGATKVVAPFSTTNYTVTVTGANGCTSSSTVQIKVNSQAMTVNAGPDVTVCPGGSTTLTATASGGGGSSFTYSWSNGLGAGATKTVSPASTTTYTVTVTSNNGCMNTDDVTVFINPPVASAGPNKTVCLGSSTTLTATVTSGGVSPFTYMWDNSLGAGATKTVSPTSNKTYRVTVTDAVGCTSTSQVSVTVAPLPQVNPGPAQTICFGSITSISASGSNGVAPYTFTWNNGLGTGASKTVSPASTTTYTVTITDAQGCTSSGQVTVTVTPKPTVSAGANVTICPGGITTLTATGSGGTPSYSYVWSNGLGSGASRTASPASTTTYTVTLTDAVGCTATSQVTVTVPQALVASAGPNVTICNGSSTTLTGSATGGTGPYTFLWDNSLGSGATKTVSPTLNRTYRVTVTDASGCTATSQVTVTVNSVPVANAGPDVNVCQNQATTLTATASGGASPYTYAWSHGLGNGASKTVVPLVTTTYTVTVTSANGCISTDQVKVTVNLCPEICFNGLDDDFDGLTDCADPDCGPTVDAGPNVTICVNEPTTLTATGNGNYSPFTYTWSHGLGTGATKTVTPSATTTYTVTITNQSGCTSTDQVTISTNGCSENCTNGIDDDFDGLIDCDDPDCVAITIPDLQDDYYMTCPGIPFSERVTYNDGNLQNPVYSIASQPAQGSVTIDATGKFFYMPFTIECMDDSFEYQVCNLATGCCATATVYLTLGDTTAPVLTNVPADITISCDDALPKAPIVTAYDLCAGIYVDFTEESDQYVVGACENYTVTRTWTATDLCGNTASAQQIITVNDLTKPELFRVYTLENGGRVVAGVSQRVTHDWKYVKFPITFSQTPVVLTQVVSETEFSAVTVQQRNVVTQGFDLRLREEEAADNKHAAEKVAWIAFEPGNQSGGFNFQANTFANVDHTLKTMNFPQVFANTPLFFSALQTTKEGDPVSIRHSGLSTASVQFYLQEETSADAEVAHQAELLGFLAINPASVIRDENDDVFGEMGTLNLTNAWNTVQLSKKYTKPVVIVGGLTSNDGHPVNIRVRNVTADSFQVRLQEWNYLDGNHNMENVSWMVLEGSIPSDDFYYCSGKANKLKPGINLFALDNCDDLTNFNFDETVSNNGALVSTRSWTANDACGNSLLFTRTDSCIVAALKVKAQLYGAFIGSGNAPLMRDELRTKELIPIREPYSDLPGFPHVNIENENYVAICHLPGTPSQQTMNVPESQLQEHLNHGDVIGGCVIPAGAPLPVEAQNATYRTIANGNWTNPATWKNGLVPPWGIMNNVKISVEHEVTAPDSNAVLSNGTRFYLTNGKLTVPNKNFTIEDAQVFFSNAVYRNVQGGMFALKNTASRVTMTNCDINILQNFQNDGGKRKLENVRLNVGFNLTSSNAAVDTFLNVSATIGKHMTTKTTSKFHIRNSEFQLTFGDIINGQDGTNCIVTGDSIIVWVIGDVKNNGTWTAPITQFCVTGLTLNMGSIFPAVEDCVGISAYFGPISYLLDSVAVQPPDTSSVLITPEEIAAPGTIDPAVLTVSGNKAMVDWLLLELRDGNNEATIVDYATVLLRRDGEIVSEDGDSIIVFPKLSEGDYYVAIRHRNHLALMTDAPIFLSTDGPPLVDFTSLSLPVRGGSFAGRPLNGTRTMWAGDFNEDGKIIYQGPGNDIFYLFSRVLSEPDNANYLANYICTGYDRHDLNLDGKIVFQGPGNDRALLLFHSILTHPQNIGMLANFVLKEILP